MRSTSREKIKQASKVLNSSEDTHVSNMSAFESMSVFAGLLLSRCRRAS
jgi:hypothetical protein